MSATLKAEVAELENLDRSELIRHWRRLYDVEPPANISQQLLLHAIAYRMQEKAIGGLKPATIRFLAQFPTDKKHTVMSTANIRIGTRLLREWHGVTYEVTILERGVMFNGKTYGSLTEVARVITGNKWSGPIFFGLRKRHG